MCAGTGGPSMGFVFKESGNAEGEVPANSNYVQPTTRRLARDFIFKHREGNLIRTCEFS